MERGLAGSHRSYGPTRCRCCHPGLHALERPLLQEWDRQDAGGAASSCTQRRGGGTEPQRRRGLLGDFESDTCGGRAGAGAGAGIVAPRGRSEGNRGDSNEPTQEAKGRGARMGNERVCARRTRGGSAARLTAVIPPDAHAAFQVRGRRNLHRGNTAVSPSLSLGHILDPHSSRSVAEEVKLRYPRGQGQAAFLSSGFDHKPFHLPRF
ncbi:hypothetical protein DFH06DRAFT_1225426 [Mycena polygramma]|nr:hypothetical protein DFH06DRAFT_1225426 [Mycena polygramma]